MRVLEAELVGVEEVHRPRPAQLWLAFKAKRREREETIIAPADKLLRFATPEGGNEAGWLYLLFGRMVSLRSAQEVVFDSEVVPPKPRARMKARGNVEGP